MATDPDDFGDSALLIPNSSSSVPSILSVDGLQRSACASSADRDGDDDGQPLSTTDIDTLPIIRPPTVDSEDSGSSWLSSSFIVMNAALGAGILNFPSSFNTAGGIVSSTAVHLVLLAVAAVTLFALGWCSDVKAADSYQAMMSSLCGRTGRLSCATFIAVYCYFTCITFLVIVGDQSDKIFHDRLGHEFCALWYLDRRFVVPLVAVAFVAPLCFPRNIDFLKIPSMIATIGVFYLTGLTYYMYIITDTSDVVVKTRPDIWTDVFTVIPSITFGYQMHVSVIPIYSRVRPRYLPNYTKMFSLALVVCFVVYTVVGIFGYLTYGTSIQDDLFSSYPSKRPAVLIGFILFGLKTLLTYPILAFCGRLALETLYCDATGRTSASDLPLTEEFRFRFGVVSVWLITSITMAIFVPNITSVIDFLGCLASAFIFIFPATCILRVSLSAQFSLSEVKKRVAFATGSALLVFGAFMFGMTFTLALQNLTRNAGPLHRICPPDTIPTW